MTSSLILVVIFLFTAVTLVPLSKKFGLGAVLGYLVGGMILGPAGAALMHNPSALLHFSELGVVILLFLIGLELKPARLFAMRKALFGLGGAQVVLTTAVIFTACLIFHGDFKISLIIGLGLSLSSTAFAIQIMSEKHELNTAYGRSSFAILLFQDLAAIPALAIIPFLATAAVRASSPDGNYNGLLKAIAVIVVLIFAGRPLIERLLRNVANARSRELFTAAALLVVLATAALMQWIGLSAALGAFLAGVLLSDSEYRHQLEADMDSFKGLLLGLFFMAIGMSLEFDVVRSYWAEMLMALAGLFLVKALIIYGLGRVAGLGNVASQNMAVVLSQGGEFAFVLFGAAAGIELLDKNTNDFLIALVTLSMLVTSLVKIAHERFILPKLTKPKAAFDSIKNEQNQVLIAGFGRVGQVPARLLRMLKIDFTAFELDADQVQLIRRFGNKVYYGDASRLDLLHAAGAAEAKFFILAIDDVESSLKTAEVVRENFPNLRIFARARNRAHVFKLMDLGITDIWRETLASSVEMSEELLIAMGHSPAQVKTMMNSFRKADDRLLQEQFKIRDNEKEMINQSKLGQEQLAEVLRRDLAQNSDELQK
jgi:transporter, monovalent cation:proton antiporter-2 (CPA2) family